MFRDDNRHITRDSKTPRSMLDFFQTFGPDFMRITRKCCIAKLPFSYLLCLLICIDTPIPTRSVSKFHSLYIETNELRICVVFVQRPTQLHKTSYHLHKKDQKGTSRLIPKLSRPFSFMAQFLKHTLLHSKKQFNLHCQAILSNQSSNLESDTDTTIEL